MNFDILKYRQICKLPESYLQYEKRPARFISIPRVDYEYYYEGFGNNETDAKDALMHAAGVIDDLMKSPSKETLQTALISDIRNFVECYNIEGFRETAYYLLQSAAAFGLLKEIYKVVDDFFHFAVDCMNEGEPLEIEQIPDFRKLYVKLGDKALFEYHDADIAIKFYELSGARWCIQEETINPIYHDENDPFSGFSEEQVNIWHHKHNQMKKILEGQNGFDTDGFDGSTDVIFMSQIFEEFVKKAKDYNPECLNVANKIIRSIGHEVRNANDKHELEH